MASAALPIGNLTYQDLQMARTDSKAPGTSFLAHLVIEVVMLGIPHVF